MAESEVCAQANASWARVVRYLPLLLLCFLTACGEPSKSELLSEVEDVTLLDIVSSGKGEEDFSISSDFFPAQSKLAVAIVELKADQTLEQYQLDDALVAASLLGAKKTVEFLVGRGANVNGRAKETLPGFTPLFAVASTSDGESVAKFLIEKGANVNVRGINTLTPLHIAAAHNNVDVAKLLISKGADVNSKTKTGKTPLALAIQNNRSTIAKLLVSRGASLSAKDNYGDTPLYDAVREGNASAVAFLIEKGARTNVKNNKGQTPLMLAIDLDKSEVEKVLREHGATLPPGYVRGGNETPVASEQASDEPQSDDEDSADEDSPDTGKFRSDYKKLHKVIRKDKSEDLAKLIDALEAGADPCAVKDEKSGQTILHYAVGDDKRPAVVKMLLNNGADPNAARTDGVSPLRLCISKDRDDAEIANILCDYGADVNAKGKDGRTVLDLAVLRNKPKTGRVLVAYGAKCTRSHPNMEMDVWKDILKRPQTRTPKNAGLARKPGGPETASTAAPVERGTIPGFGSTTRRGNTLEGIIFDLKRSNKGVLFEPTAKDTYNKRKERLHDAVHILDNGWNLETLKKKYTLAPQKLYTTSIFFADEKGGAFNPKKAVEAFRAPFDPIGWLCYYEGYFGVPEEGDYRFVGMGNDILLVGVDKKTVLYAFWPGEGHGPCVKYVPGWGPDNCCGPAGNDGKGVMVRGNNALRSMLYRGSYLHLIPGKRYFIQIAFGKVTGGKAGAWLGIQMKGRDSENNFPLFTLEKVKPDPQLQVSERGAYNTNYVFRPPSK